MKVNKVKIKAGSGATLGQLMAVPYKVPRAVKDTEVNMGDVTYILNYPLNQEDYDKLINTLDEIVADRSKIKW